MSTQPEALKLADDLDEWAAVDAEFPSADLVSAAAELRRLHERVQELEAQRVSIIPASIDELAQEIRRIEGSNNMGAGELAEALTPWLIRRVTIPAGWCVEVKKGSDEYPIERAVITDPHGEKWGFSEQDDMLSMFLLRFAQSMLAAAPQPERPWESRQAETQLPTIAEMESKLKRRGWVLSCQIRDVATVWHKGDAEVLLPLSTNLKDYTARMRDAIKLIASAPQPETRES